MFGSHTRKDRRVLGRCSQFVATFSSCGIDTQQGLAELNKIPTACGGLSGTNYSNTGNNTNTGNGGSNTGNNGSYTGGLN